MNVNRNLKLLLLKLGMQGHDVSLIQEQRYSKEYRSVYSRYKLTFWKEGTKINKKTGEEKEVRIPDTYEFNSAIDLLKYMVVRANEGAT
ncbi:hypothetical protein M3629_03770 [Paenibacillus polysaccharolyticus]|uniref:hypothetical protein n=1 Tax=Paenibacillus polysaccharolyticus TaxID=582692 RepID=UPI00203FF86E|nr:hypothetical protein [Paenibacillus polysaccharolyticus]MCM3131886.1 hypothetical protein [Paenibacillus polysaccharolyticus]